MKTSIEHQRLTRCSRAVGLFACRRISGFIVTAAVLACGAATFTHRSHAQGGVPLWTNRYNGPENGSDYANSIAVEPHGVVIVVGSSYAGINHDYFDFVYY